MVLKNDGAGNFTVQPAVPQLVTKVISMVAGDFNGDGLGDLVILSNATSPDSIEVFFGDGAGNFNPGPVFPTNLSTFPTGFALAAGPFGLAGTDAFFAATDSSTLTLWQDLCP